VYNFCICFVVQKYMATLLLETLTVHCVMEHLQPLEGLVMTKFVPDAGMHCQMPQPLTSLRVTVNVRQRLALYSDFCQLIPTAL